jgi:aspartate carbamoyltransferase catalytic subunit
LLNPFYGKDILSIRDFSKDDLEYLFKITNTVMSTNPDKKRQIAADKLLGLLFYEPSSRTKLSFESAMYSIGGHCTGITEPATSAIEKGENLADTVSVVAGYTDVVVLRHPNEGAARFAAEISDKPIVNAGSGTEEHPTQAMLDLYTISRLKGEIGDLNIGIMGDLRYGRTVYSLLYALSKYSPRIHLISPPELRIRNEALLDIKGKTQWTEHDQIEDVICDLDVLYVTRIQKERFPDPAEYQRVKDSYYVDKALLQKGKTGLILLHPLPRIGEIRTEVDSLPNAKYYLQARLGKDLRAALLALILNSNL